MSNGIVKSIDVEGVILPNKPLSNFELDNAAKKLHITCYRGSFVRDKLPKTTKPIECGIINSVDSTGNCGHWTCWMKLNNEKYYFDSYGLRPPDELVEYLTRPIYYNTERIQPDGEVFCGHLCLFVLRMLCKGYNFQEIINSLY